MSKPREWWIRPDASYAREFVWPPDYDWMGDADDKVHVIEKSAYDELLAEARKLRDALNQIDVAASTEYRKVNTTAAMCARTATKAFDKFLTDRGT